MLKCLEFARNLATINNSLTLYSDFEAFILSKESDIIVETNKKYNKKRVPFQEVEGEIYKYLLGLSAHKATKCNVYLGVSVLKSLGYVYYMDEPEAGERRYKFKFHNMIRDMRRTHEDTLPPVSRHDSTCDDGEDGDEGRNISITMPAESDSTTVPLITDAESSVTQFFLFLDDLGFFAGDNQLDDCFGDIPRP